MIILAQSRQGLNVVYKVQPLTAMPLYAACTMAFSSAWLHKHWCKHDGVFFGVAAQALVQTLTGGDVGVAARAAAVRTVFHSARRAVVTGRNHLFVTHQYGGDLSAGTIAAGGGDMGDVHKITIP